MPARRHTRKTEQKVQWNITINKPFVLASVLVIIVLAGAVWVTQLINDPETFPLRSVRVEGQFNYLTAQELEKAVGPRVGKSFFNINVDGIKEVTRELPWVETVSVRRMWPDGLRIIVTEQKAFARWNKNSLLNAEGIVFTPDAKTIPAGLPMLSGPDGTELKVLAHYMETEKQLAPAELHLKQLTLNARHAWTAELDNGMTLLLGRKNSQQRLARFIRIYKTVFAESMNHNKRIDLRYSNGFTIYGKKVSTAVLPAGKFRG
ncbi:MAG: cell division protein FtsQ/DivIB [Gammaproteobacteria bacterium]|nr:cell division protein FtsQ/DivIB [Gammaproteobacteria bacterium]